MSTFMKVSLNFGSKESEVEKIRKRLEEYLES